MRNDSEIFYSQVRVEKNENGESEIYVDNQCVAVRWEGRDDPEFVIDVLTGLGYLVSEDRYDMVPMLPEERKYSYSQSSQISAQTGLIGYLRADFGSGGKEFWSTWNDWRKDLKTDEFKEEFDDIINDLREQGGVLNGRSAMAKYCYEHPEAAYQNVREEYGIRIDSPKYTYLLRLCPNPGEYNLYCYCYVQNWLDSHIRDAKQGIRFITPDYKEIFRIPDGDKVRITFADGETADYICRYIDPYHVEVGDHLWHICQVAEKMEEIGAKIVPLRSSLPEQCYAVHMETGEIIVVKKGETGYYKTDITTSGKEESEQIVWKYNAKLGVSKAQAEAMYCGSVFGFETPGADPKNYDESGRLVMNERKDRGEER